MSCHSEHPRFWRYYVPVVVTLTFLVHVWEVFVR